jgi:hypothetical protein
MPLPDAARVDIVVVQGEDVSYTFTLLDVDDQPINLGGCVITAECRRSAEDDHVEPPLLEFNCEVVGDGSDGQLTLSLLAEDTEELNFAHLTKYPYDVKFVWPGADEEPDVTRRFIYGTVVFHRAVTA